ncbi:MAG: glucose-6-phosphate dehydrogenase [Sedimentisphaerales bacterium]|nr:glucose-6-phosphate dehydrogenase [Sedimentisphaerales bacterium]
MTETENKRTEPFSLVIFGASGNLTSLKLIPALFELFHHDLLAIDFAIIGIARRELGQEEFHARLYEDVKKADRCGNLTPENWAEFCKHIHYLSGDGNEPETFDNLRNLITSMPFNNGQTGSCLFYCSVKPELFSEIAFNLHKSGLSQPETPEQFRRIIIEKPFGTDLDSAINLNKELKSYFKEEQIFRIDHYLGKETVQNILALRFANRIFDSVWNKDNIDHIQISVCEMVDVGQRGSYYDQSGALRDMVQNHIMQLLALVAMERPESLSARAIRNEKVKVISSIRPVCENHCCCSVVTGQYTDGKIEDKAITGYLNCPGVSPASITETFVAFKLFVDTPSMADVPIYIRTGKALAKKMTDICIYFKPVTNQLFGPEYSSGCAQNSMNCLVLRIQPNDGVSVNFFTHKTGRQCLEPRELDFYYPDFCPNPIPSAYEKLLHDALSGDQTLFIRSDETEAAWRFITPLINSIKLKNKTPEPYQPGTFGPEGADKLMACSGRKWRN